MAKRFTDSEKWADPWFGSLPMKIKLAWVYLCDMCDTVGVWKVNPGMISFQIGESVTAEELKTHLGRRLVWLSDEKVWIPGFIPFQYGTLSFKNKAHIGIIRKIVSLTANLPLTGPARDLIETFKTLDRGSSEGQQTPQEEVKEKEKEKNSSLEKGSGEKPNTLPIDFKIKTLEDLVASIPIITLEKWARDYPDEAWRNQQISLAFDFHTADPGYRPHTAGQWMRKLISWLGNNWPKRIKKQASLDDLDLDERVGT